MIITTGVLSIYILGKDYIFLFEPIIYIYYIYMLYFLHVSTKDLASFRQYMWNFDNILPVGSGL